jgi:cystathionine beta-lyase/cystathionine gamma-synthase
MKKLQTYKFTYIAWIPYYRDTDIDYTFVQASSEEDAWAQFKQRPMYKLISPTSNPSVEVVS